MSPKGSEPAQWAPLGPLDLVSAWMHRPERPLDFGQLLLLKDSAPDQADLQRGGESARCAFAQSGSLLVGERWKWAPSHFLELQEDVAPSHLRLALESFMLKPFDLEKQNPVQQLLVESEGSRFLLTRMHHALADGLGCMQWVAHQLEVARGERPAETSPTYAPSPVLSKHNKAHRKTPDSGPRASTRLWASDSGSGAGRRWQCLEIEADRWRARLENIEGITYNDLLAGTCLEAMCRWNKEHGAESKGLGLWFPMNIREQAFEGFGNGSSRVRIYQEPCTSLIERCQSLRRQLRWSRENGEWHLPRSAVFSWPTWLKRPLLKRYLNRPGVDMGSMLYSHVEKSGELGESIFRDSDGLQWIGMLDIRYPAGFVGASHGARTWMTLTWDPSMWTDEEAVSFLALYESLLDDLAEELDT